MKITYHITFADGSNPYVAIAQDKTESIKSIQKWLKHYSVTTNRFDIWIKGLRITSNPWGTWSVYKSGKYCDTVLKEYLKLGNAIRYIEREF